MSVCRIMSLKVNEAYLISTHKPVPNKSYENNINMPNKHPASFILYFDVFVFNVYILSLNSSQYTTRPVIHTSGWRIHIYFYKTH